MDLRGIGEDGVHSLNITKNNPAATFHMRLPPREIRKGLENGEAGRAKPHGKPGSSSRLLLYAGIDITQHLQNRLFLARHRLYFNVECLSALCTLLSQNLHSAMIASRVLRGRPGN